MTRRLLDLPRKRIDEVLDLTGLRDAGDRRVREYSLGMRQRLALALSLLPSPGLLILDEPSNGLDPAGILDMRRLLRDLAQQGITVFVSSHLLGEIELIASHFASAGGPASFRRTAGGIAGPRASAPADPLRRSRAGRRGPLRQAGERISDLDAEGLKVHLHLRSEQDINRLLVGRRIGVSHLAREAVSLESLFFTLTGDLAREQAA